MLRNLWVFPLVVLVVLVASAQAPAASFEALGYFGDPSYPTSCANAVSADGEVVVGSSKSLPFRWTPAEGMVNFAGLTAGQGGYAYDISADGSAIVGSIRLGPGVGGPYRWTNEGGLLILPPLPGWEDYRIEATGVSGDASVVVGRAGGPSYPERLFRWTDAEGMVDLGPMFNPGDSLPDISADGSVIVATDPVQGAFRWTQETGRVYLGTPPDALEPPAAVNVSADGTTIVGRITYRIPGEDDFDQAFRWTAEDGLTLLFGAPVGDHVAYAASADGSLVVGGAQGGSGFIWDAAHGARDLREVLEGDYGLDTSAFQSIAARGLSADGRVIVGWGMLAQSGYTQAWRAVIPEPSTSTLTVTFVLALLLFLWRKRHTV